MGKICKVVRHDLREDLKLPIQLPLGYCPLEQGTFVLVISDLGSDFFSVLTSQGENIISHRYLELCHHMNNSMWDV